MNKIKLSLVLLLPFILVGCKGDDIRNFKKEGFSLDKTSFKCELIHSFNFLGSNYAVGDDGKLYLINYDLIFKNGNNCKILDDNLSVVSIYDDEIFKLSDGKLYKIDLVNNKLVLATNVDKTITFFSADSDIIKVMEFENNYYVLKKDGNVYKYVLGDNLYNSNITVSSYGVFFDKSSFGGNIVDFEFHGDSGLTYVKVYDVYYRNQIINEECLKYADVRCEYKVIEDKNLVRYRNEIFGFNGSTLILNNKKVLSYQDNK